MSGAYKVHVPAHTRVKKDGTKIHVKAHDKLYAAQYTAHALPLGPYAARQSLYEVKRAQNNPHILSQLKAAELAHAKKVINHYIDTHPLTVKKYKKRKSSKSKKAAK